MASKKRKVKLRGRRAVFAQEYLKDRNGTQAAIRAGYSKKTAGVQACRLLKDVHIMLEIDRLDAARAERSEVEADDVIRELARLGLSDVRRLFDEKGALLPIADWPVDVSPAVSSVEVVEIWEEVTTTNEAGEQETKRQVVGHTKKLKFWDKNRSLEMLGRHLKLFEGEGPGGGGVTVINMINPFAVPPEGEADA